jgi:CRP/FNR family transcriptional regulator, anaerobic regulatory protein
MSDASFDQRAALPDWVGKFPQLNRPEDPVWLKIASRARLIVLPAGHEIFTDGDPCENYILVLSGHVRVFKSFENGREMLLYRLNAGETCSLTTSILLAGGNYSGTAMTEAETHAVIIPISQFHEAFDNSKLFRDFVCSTFGGRIRDFIMLIESIATRNVDVRLARWLLENNTRINTVEASHRSLAFELGTAREVVSRHLKEFEANGWVKLSRKNIELLQPDAMHQLINGTRA